MDAKVKERVMFTISLLGACATIITLILTVKNHYENKQHIDNQQELTALQLQDAKNKLAAKSATTTDTTI